MGSISRGIDLVKMSIGVIRQNRSLLLFPLISGLVMLTILLSFGGLIYLFPATFFRMPIWTWFVIGYLFYFIMFHIGFYFQAALVACAMRTLEGEKPKISYGLKEANKHLGAILNWAAIAALVGTILSSLEQRTGRGGRVLIYLVGAAWTVATFFVIPVIIFENEGVRSSIKRSLSIMKSSWGETLVGSFTIGAFFIYLAAPMVLITLLSFIMGSFLLSLIVAVACFIYMVFLVVLASAVSGVLRTVLYRFATTGSIELDLPMWFPMPPGQYSMTYAYEPY